MAAEKSNAASVGPDSSGAHHLAITRLIDAPRELVFKAWTDPAHLAKWFFLDAFATTHTDIDVRPGGKWVMNLRTADGMEITARRVYREIVEPERIVFYEKCDAGGNIILDGTHTVTFEAVAGKTRLTIECDLVTPFDADNQRGWNNGWAEVLGRLATHVAKG